MLQDSLSNPIVEMKSEQVKEETSIKLKRKILKKYLNIQIEYCYMFITNM